MNEEHLHKLARECFLKYDKDSNSKLDRDELKKLLSETATDLKIEAPTTTEIDMLFEQFDENSDNHLSEKEFFELFKVIYQMK